MFMKMRIKQGPEQKHRRVLSRTNSMLRGYKRKMSITESDLTSENNDIPQESPKSKRAGAKNEENKDEE